MSVFPILLAALLAAEPDAASLVARLGAASEAERAAIAARLDAMGLQAIGALRVATRDADTQVRLRASELLEKIENGLLVRPSLVTLEAHDQTIAEVIASIRAQTGIALVLEPRGDPVWDGLRIKVGDARPLPFWEVLDRIGSAARLHHNPAFASGTDERTPVFHLEEGARPFPQSVSGPFRVGLVSIRRRHAIVFETAGGEAADDSEPDAEQFEVLVQVFAEPQLTITLNGPPKDLKARDDFDQDLVPPPSVPDGEADDAAVPPSGASIEPGTGPVPGSLSIVQFPIALQAPERPGTTVQSLEGIVPLQVAIHRPDPLTIRLADAFGRSFEADDLVVRFPDVRTPDPPSGSLELFVRLKTRADALAPVDAEAPPDFPEARPVDTLQNRLEVLDSRQWPLAYRVVSARADDSGEWATVIRLSGSDARAMPIALRIHSLIVGAVEVPFRFEKLPIP